MASSLEGLKDIITCSLCFEVFNGKEHLPKCLPCSHTFCLDCLHKLVTSKADFNIPCPLCNIKYQIPTGGAVAIPTNIAIKQICDSLPHQKQEGSIKCKLHSEMCNVVCTECYIPLCDDCMIGLATGKHLNHKLDKIKPFIASLRNEKKDVRDKYQKRIMNFKKIVEENNKHFEEQQEYLIESAEEKAKRAHSMVDTWLSTTIKAIKQSDCKSSESIFPDLLDNGDFETSICNGDLSKAKEYLDKTNEKLLNVEAAIFEKSEEVKPIGYLSVNFTIDLGSLLDKPYFAQKVPIISPFSTSEIGNKVHEVIGLMKTASIAARDKSLTLLESTNYKYKQVWEKPRPEGISRGCRKYLLQNRHILLQNDHNAQTKEFSADLKHIRDYAGDIGTLIGVLPSNLLAYSDQDKKVSLYRYLSFDKVVTLRVKNSLSSSICANPVTGQLAVATGNPNTLHILDATGKALHATIFEGELRYTSNALAATSMYILVMLYDPVAILVYNWEGRKLAQINHNQLKLSDSCDVNRLDAITTIGEHQFVIAGEDRNNDKHVLKVFSMH